MEPNEGRYARNYIYVSASEQADLREQRIVFGGVGLGSVIAEAALRLGFESLFLIDGDIVEESNLNRQNYTLLDVEKSKVEALRRRLLAIHPKARIDVHHGYLTSGNLGAFLRAGDIAINALDFDSDAPFAFDRHCQVCGIPVLHPLNFGWSAAAYVVTPNSPQLASLYGSPSRFELPLIDHTLAQLTASGAEYPRAGLQKLRREYPNHLPRSPPQLSIGASLAAALTASLIYQIASGQPVHTFPRPYYLSTETG